MSSQFVKAARRVTHELHGVVVSSGLMEKTVKVRVGGQKWNKIVNKVSQFSAGSPQGSILTYSSHSPIPKIISYMTPEALYVPGMWWPLYRAGAHQNISDMW